MKNQQSKIPACLSYRSKEQLEIIRRQKRARISSKCAETRQEVKDVTQRLIEAGALDNTEPTMLPDGFYGMVYEFRQGKTCYLCNDKKDDERILVKYVDPKTRIQTLCSVHKFHLN